MSRINFQSKFDIIHLASSWKVAQSQDLQIISDASAATFEKIVWKGENAHDGQSHPMPQCFNTIQ